MALDSASVIPCFAIALDLAASGFLGLAGWLAVGWLVMLARGFF